MTDPALARDEAGNVRLTTEQAVIVADWVNGFEDQSPESEALWWTFFFACQDAPAGALHPDNSHDALARWVLRYAPVVEAAELQERAVRAYERECMTDAPALSIRTRSQEHAVTVHATEAAVRVARDGQP